MGLDWAELRSVHVIQGSAKLVSVRGVTFGFIVNGH